jgi:TRAP-type C4-dicarboxylate transport system permease small subunit
MKNVNIWFFVWMAFVGVVLSFCNLNPLQFGVLVFMFSAADLIGGPTKRAGGLD